MASNQVAIVLKLIDKASGNMNKISKSAKTMSNSMQKMGSSLTKNVSLPLAAIGVAGVKMAADFDKSMRNIQSMGHQTEAELGALGDQFKAMSMDMTKTTDSADGLARAYYNIQSAGFAGEEGMEVLSVATKAASAGLTDTKIAAESIMGVLSSYQLEAKDAARVSDIMFQAVTRGMMTFDQLAAAMPAVTGQAAALGVSIEEVSAAFSTMSKAGVNTANASTQISAVLTELTKGNTQLTAAAKALGFASSRAMLEQKGLAGTMRLLEQYAASAGIKVDSLFNNIRAAKGVFALTGANAKVFAGDLAAMGDSVGATQAAFEEQMKSFSAQFSNFKNTLGVFLMEIGEQLLPILTQVINAIRPIVKAFAELPDPVKKAIVVFGLLATTLGPILMIGGKLVGLFGTLKAAFVAIPTVISTITGLLPALGTAFTVLTGPIGLVAAGLAALIAFGPKIIEFAKNVLKGIGEFLADPIGTIGKGIGKLFGYGVADGMTEGIGKGIQQTGKMFKSLANSTNQFANAMRQKLVQSVQPATQAMGVAAGVATAQAQNRFYTSGAGVRTMSIRRGKSPYAFTPEAMPSWALTLDQAASAMKNTFSGGGQGLSPFHSLSRPEQLQRLISSPDISGADKAKYQAEFAGLTPQAAGGGDVNITIEAINVSPEKEQMVKDVMKEVAKELKRYGFSGRRITGA